MSVERRHSRNPRRWGGAGILPEMLGPCEGLISLARQIERARTGNDEVGYRTFAGLQMSQTCTGTPFFALLTRPVIGVNLMGTSPGGGWGGIGRIGLFD